MLVNSFEIQHITSNAETAVFKKCTLLVLNLKIDFTPAETAFLKKCTLLVLKLMYLKMHFTGAETHHHAIL